MPKDSPRVFRVTYDTIRKSFDRERRRLAKKLQNPRIMCITFHTFRHWKATVEYAKTKDILHAMRVLGHRNINNTLIYTHLVNFKEDEYVAKVARTEEEICELVEAASSTYANTTEQKYSRSKSVRVQLKRAGWDLNPRPQA